MRRYDVPGADAIEIEHVILDLNGVLSNRGELIPGVAERLRRLAWDLAFHIVTADTRGTADRLAASLPVSIVTIARGSEEADLVRRLGADRTASIGPGGHLTRPSGGHLTRYAGRSPDSKSHGPRLSRSRGCPTEAASVPPPSRTRE